MSSDSSLIVIAFSPLRVPKKSPGVHFASAATDNRMPIDRGNDESSPSTIMREGEVRAFNSGVSFSKDLCLSIIKET